MKLLCTLIFTAIIYNGCIDSTKEVATEKKEVIVNVSQEDSIRLNLGLTIQDVNWENDTTLYKAKVVRVWQDIDDTAGYDSIQIWERYSLKIAPDYTIRKLIIYLNNKEKIIREFDWHFKSQIDSAFSIHVQFAFNFSTSEYECRVDTIDEIKKLEVDLRMSKERKQKELMAEISAEQGLLRCGTGDFEKFIDHWNSYRKSHNISSSKALKIIATLK